MVQHLNWDFNIIADEVEINSLIDEVVNGADRHSYYRYEKYLPCLADEIYGDESPPFEY
jgi:hypothetical protein